MKNRDLSKKAGCVMPASVFPLRPPALRSWISPQRSGSPALWLRQIAHQRFDELFYTNDGHIRQIA